MRMIEEYLNLTPEELAAILACTPRQAQQKLTGEDDFTSVEIERIKDYFEISDEQMKQLLEYWS